MQLANRKAPSPCNVLYVSFGTCTLLSRTIPTQHRQRDRPTAEDEHIPKHLFTEMLDASEVTEYERSYLLG